MRCFVLDATNKSITAVLAGAPATTNPDFTAAYGDAITTTFTEGANDGVLNGATPVTIVAAPAASTRRIVTAISIQNRDTAAVVLTVRYVDGANTRQIWSGTLAVGDTWTMDGVMNALGSMKTAFAGSHTALSDIGTNTHAQIDTHIADTSDPHGANLSQSTINLTGGQIAFPAAQAASVGVNTLDDYEEGTWTPSLGGNTTYTTQLGGYVKIGRLVWVRGRIAVNVLGTGSTSQISGLPFTSETVTGDAFSGYVSYFANLAVNVLFIALYVESGATTMYFVSATAAGATCTNAPAIFGNGATIAFTACYPAAS